MIYREPKGSTPKYKASFYDENNAVINPSSAFTKIIVKIYNNNTGDLLIGFTSESPVPDEIEGYYNCTRTSTQVKWAIPAEVTADAQKGENRCEIWTYRTDSDIPDEGVAVECISGVLNEFIDAQIP